MSDINPLAKVAYEQGYSPVTFAELSIGNLIEAHSHIVAGRALDPGLIPDLPIELTASALASRIVGTLLDAGWTAPGDLVDMSERPR